MKCCKGRVYVFHQLLRGAPDSLLRSLHIQKDPSAYNYIKVGSQIKVLLIILITQKSFLERVCLKRLCEFVLLPLKTT